MSLKKNIIHQNRIDDIRAKKKMMIIGQAGIFAIRLKVEHEFCGGYRDIEKIDTELAKIEEELFYLSENLNYPNAQKFLKILTTKIHHTYSFYMDENYKIKNNLEDFDYVNFILWKEYIMCRLKKRYNNVQNYEMKINEIKKDLPSIKNKSPYLVEITDNETYIKIENGFISTGINDLKGVKGLSLNFYEFNDLIGFSNNSRDDKIYKIFGKPSRIDRNAYNDIYHYNNFIQFEIERKTNKIKHITIKDTDNQKTFEFLFKSLYNNKIYDRKINCLGCTKNNIWNEFGEPDYVGYSYNYGKINFNFDSNDKCNEISINFF